MEIRELGKDEAPPWELLELADPSRINVEAYIRNGSVYIGFESEEIIGVYVLKETTRETVEIMNIAIKESCQRRGLGKQLLTHAIGEATNKGYAEVEVGTGNSSIYQLLFYQLCGFRIVGVDFDFFIRNYDEPIYENGLRCRDMIRLCYTTEG